MPCELKRTREVETSPEEDVSALGYKGHGQDTPHRDLVLLRKVDVEFARLHVAIRVVWRVWSAQLIMQKLAWRWDGKLPTDHDVLPGLERRSGRLDALVARLERVLVDVRVPGRREVRAEERGFAERGVTYEEDEFRRGRRGEKGGFCGDEVGFYGFVKSMFRYPESRRGREETHRSMEGRMDGNQAGCTARLGDPGSIPEGSVKEDPKRTKRWRTSGVRNGMPMLSASFLSVDE